MSRSYKHTPVCGATGCVSEKWDKRLCNKTLRKLNRMKIAKTIDWDDVHFYVEEEILTDWDMSKDGKYWFGHLAYSQDDYYRDAFIRLMRK